MEAQNSPLGKETEYQDQYHPDLLFPMARQQKRDEIGVQSGALPFYGFDLWNHYEVSWLDRRGKPQVAVVQVEYPCDSESLIESKSMKLYFNSFNNTQFDSKEVVRETISHDIASRIGKPSVRVDMIDLSSRFGTTLQRPPGILLDDLDIECSDYDVNPDSLEVGSHFVEEYLYTDLFRSNCLVTGQPDWATVVIHYEGKAIERAGLLQYLVSFRNHQGFHEHCIEHAFMNIQQRCKPVKLSIQGCFTRRGGIEINAFRSSDPKALRLVSGRLVRQ